MINNMNIGTKVKALKNIYYVNPSNIHEDFYTQEEIMIGVPKIISVGDVYELKTDDWECIEGSMKGESNEGWFEFEEVIKKDCFEII